MQLAAMLTSLPVSFADAARLSAELGFEHVDVVAAADRPASDLEALAEHGLLVSCVALGRGLPEGQTLDAADPALRRAALDAMKQQLADAALLGARVGYVVPALDGSREAMLRFGDTLQLLADEAGRRMIRLCLEPVPGRALPSADSVLRLLQDLPHPHLHMLLDIGHCLITSEDPSAIVHRAGPRLGYVHLDDNDGQGDLHWPLLTGKLTRSLLAGFLHMLDEVGYARGLALELNPANPHPVEALRSSRCIIQDLLPGG